MAELKPFPQKTSEGIERANRFLALKSHPAFNDLVRLSQALVAEASNILVDYPGWDKDQIAVLKARAQAAKEHHERFFAEIESSISVGVTEAKNALDEKRAAGESDQLRASVLSSTGDSRVTGSY